MFKKNSQGFTIIEIIIVLVIIGIIGVYAAPHVNMIKQQEVRKLAKEMSLDLTTQRLRAMATSGTNFRFELTSTAGLGFNGYRLTPANLTASGTSNLSLDNSKSINITMQTSPTGIATTVSAIQFDNYGYMMDDLGVNEIGQLIIDINYDGLTSQINFNGVTGHYEVQ